MRDYHNSLGKCAMVPWAYGPSSPAHRPIMGPETGIYLLTSQEDTELSNLLMDF